MPTELKKKIKTGGIFGGVLGGGALLGFAQGSGIDHIFADKILDALKSGDVKTVLGYGLLFVLIWLQVRYLAKGQQSMTAAITELKEEIAKVNSPTGQIAKSFAKGEERFNAIEQTQIQLVHRMTVVEQKITQGGFHENTCTV